MTRTAAVWVRPERPADGFLPEGPREMTLADRPAVVWVNIQTAPDATAGEVYARFWDTGEVRRFGLPDRPGFVRVTDRPDRLLVGAGQSLLLFDPLTGHVETLATLPGADPRCIVNDAEVVPGGGAVVFGTKVTGSKEHVAAIYLLTLADRRVTQLAGGMKTSNGKVVHRTAGGLTLFDIDTPTRQVRRFGLDAAARTLTPDGTALDLSAEHGFPDGMTDAGDGSVVVAFFNPDPAPEGRAKRFRLADGTTLDEWRVPGSPRVTCPLLVRQHDGVRLVMTTATEGMPAEQSAVCPNAGCLFLADADGCDPPAAEVVRLG